MPLSAHAATKVAIRASGFRFSPSASSIEVTIGGHRVQVLNYAPGKDPGMDELTLAIPASLRGLGETDLIARVNGRVANVVRINLGS